MACAGDDGQLEILIGLLQGTHHLPPATYGRPLNPAAHSRV